MPGRPEGGERDEGEHDGHPDEQRGVGSGSRIAITVAPISPARIGAIRPARSEKRPASGLITASTAALTRNTAPIVAPATPRSSSRSGTSTSITPANSAGIVNIQKPSSTAGRASERGASLGCPGSPRARQPASSRSRRRAPRRPPRTALNTASGLSTVAAPPRTGPSSTPTMAALSAAPISSPRRSGGDADDEPRHAGRPHARATDALDEAGGVEQHDVCRRTRSRGSRARASRARASSVGFTPQRVASQPDGSAPTNVPAG